MRRILTLIAAGVAGATIALLALSFVGRAFAQGPAGQPAQPTPGAAPYGQGQMMGRGQMGGNGHSLVGMAAAELSLTQAELVAQFGADGTIAAALEARGIDPEGFIDRFVASRAERLDAAVAAGRLTREQADARIATARSMAAAHIEQPLATYGPGGQDSGTCCAPGEGFVDANGDGICDHQPAGGRGPMGGGRGGRP